MKKYKEYIKRLCALLLVCTLVVSQDLMPVHALTDNTTVTESTENEINATAGENTEATNGGQIEAQTPENSAVESGNEKGGTVGEEIKENVDQAGNGANLPENNAESTTPSGDDENQVNTAEDPAEEGIIQDDRLLPEETTEDEIMPADAGTTENQYPEGSIHVNPSDTEKTDPLGNTVTVKPGNNTTGEGSLEKPYYSLGKAYNAVDMPGEGETTEKNIYVHSGVIVSGEEDGTDENGTGIVVSTGAVKSATYFAADKKLVVNQADDLDALFAIEGGVLTLQNMKLNLMNNSATTDAEMRVALSGGQVILKNGITVPDDKFYFRVNNTLGSGTSAEASAAPMDVNALPKNSAGMDEIPVVMSQSLVETYLIKKDTPYGEGNTETKERTIKIPIAKVSDASMVSAFVLKGIGTVGNLKYDLIDSEDYAEKITENSKVKCTTQWNEKLSFTEEGGIVYLTGYHKTVSQRKVEELEYKGVVYVGKNGNDDNDGLSYSTPVKTLNKAKERMDDYDEMYKEQYPYPKIVMVGVVEVTDTQSLDFKGYETKEDAEFAPSNTGYRASLWIGTSTYYSNEAPFCMKANSTLNLGEGVRITDYRLDDKDAGIKKPEEIGKTYKYNGVFVRNDVNNATINLEKIDLEGFPIVLNMTQSTTVNIKDSTIKGCNCLINSAGSNMNINITGDTVVECEEYNLNMYHYSEGYRVKIALTGEAILDATGNPSGKGYLYSKKGGILNFNGGYLPTGRQTRVDIESGLLVGNDDLINLRAWDVSIYMKGDTKYYQQNKEKSIIGFLDSDNSNSRSMVYYEGGIIRSMGKAFAMIYDFKRDGENFGVVFNGGTPIQNGKPLKIITQNQWTRPHIFLGKGQEAFYSKNEFREMVQLELYDKEETTPFKDMSKIVGRMDAGDDLGNVRNLFKILHDEKDEMYDGKILMKTQDGNYLVIGINGIYINGDAYDEEKQSGGRPYPTAKGSLGDPVLTFMDAQKVYDSKSDEEKKKLKGIFILEQIEIPSGKDITVAGTGGAAKDISNTDKYICNFDNLTIYDTGLECKKYSNEWGYVYKAIYVNGGKLTLDHTKLDGNMVTDRVMRNLICIKNTGEAEIKDSKLENLNYYGWDYGVIHVLGINSKLHVLRSELTETNNKEYSHIVCCEEKASCTIEDSKIQSKQSNSSSSAVLLVMREGQLSLKNTEVLSEKSTGIRTYAGALLDLENAKIMSTDNIAISVAGNYGHGANVTVKISGGIIKGIRAFELHNASYNSSYNGETQIAIKNKANLISTNGNAIELGVERETWKINVNLSDAIIEANKGNGIYFANKNPESSLIMDAANADEKVEIQTKDEYDGVVMQTDSTSIPIYLGGNIVIKGENAQDFNLIKSCSTFYLKHDLTGNNKYTVKTMTNHVGATLVDCKDVPTDAASNQEKFIIWKDSLSYYDELGIEFSKSPNPEVKGAQELVIPQSTYIFWDWKNGDDNNSKIEGGGHSKKLAVKSPNGVRAVLMKEGYIQPDGTADPNKTQEPVKVLALSEISGLYQFYMNKYIDAKCYGDHLEGGKYVVSKSGNEADIFNWIMPEPQNGSYLIDIKRAEQVNIIVKEDPGRSTELQIKNVKFSDLNTIKMYTPYLELRGDWNNIDIDCCCFEATNTLGSIIRLGNVYGQESNFRNVTIKGGKDSRGIESTGSDNSNIIIDQTKIIGTTYGLYIDSCNNVIIKGNDTYIEGCHFGNYYSSRDPGKVEFKSGIITNNNYSGPYAVELSDNKKYYQTGTAQIITKTNGIYINNRSTNDGFVYLYGGEIKKNTDAEEKTGTGVQCTGWYNQVYLKGTKIQGFNYGIYSGIVSMEDGSITENNIGFYSRYTSDSSMIMSGGTVSNNKQAGILNVNSVTMSGGEISGNGQYGNSDNGGIVKVNGVTMKDGIIRKNAGYEGGGISSRTINISGGVIEDNVATRGGAIAVNYQGKIKITGGIIRNNKADGSKSRWTYSGAGAIYCDSDSSAEINGGNIYGNKTIDKDGKQIDATGEIFNDSVKNLKLGKSGTSYPKIKDTIYLAKKDSKIELTAAVRGDYNIRVVEGYDGFKKGDSIVIPNGDSVQSAASYLTRFTLLSDSYVLARKGKNLVLDGILFVNGTTGTNGDGALPNKPRNDFKTVIEDANYNDNVIYITGAVHIKNGDNVVVNDRTIRRYTGQPLNGQKYDANIYNEPLFIVDKGATLTLINCTVSGRMGAKSDETYSQDTGYLIENYGTLNIDVDSSGSGIAAGVEKQTHSVLADNLTGGLGIAQHGTLNISPFSQIDQMVKLGGKNVKDTAVYYGTCANLHSLTQQKNCTDTKDRFINIYGDTAGTGLQKKLNLDVDHKEDGRLVTSYTALDKSASLQTEKTQHQIKDLKASGFYLTSRIPSTVTRAAATTQTVDMILKRPGIYYVDGTNGNDENEGTCPDKALKTLEKAYEKLDADAKNPEITSRGGIIYIVENVDLTGTITIKEDGDASVMTAESSTYNTQGDVIIRRYSKPTIGKDGYTTETNTGTMFTIADAANVSIQGVTIDGHSQKLDSTDDTLAAEGVTNADAIFSVNGKLTLGSGGAVTKNTLVQNNDASGKNGGLIRVEQTGNLCLTGDMPKEADLEEGQAAVYGTRLSGGKAANGNAIYADLGGTTELAHGAKADYPEIDGSIYLTGNKTTIATESGKYSSFVTIADGTAGAITDNRYEFEVQDAYNGRLVVSYPTGTTLSAADVKGYTVNGRQGYDVAVNDAEKSQIILKALGAVYIDGVSGADTNDGTAPKKSVKTLKRAYELLKAKKGGVLYVVNTVTITDAQELTETSYKNYGTTVALTEGTVQIQRYGKPTAYGSPDWIESDTADYFNVESNANALFSVSGSGMLDLKNIQIDGHKDAVALKDSLAYKTNAGAIEATAPLIQVDGGKLNLGEGAVLQNNKNTTAPGSTTSTTASVPGGAVYNSGTMNITGGVVKGNECKGTARSYTTTGEAAETVTVTPDASGIWQAGKMNVNVSDTAKLTWDVDQYIYLAEQGYDSKETEQADKDAKVSFLNVQALPTDQVLPLDLNRDGASTGSGSTGSAAGWFAPGRKVVEMSTEGMVTADNFKVNGDSYVGSWLEGTGALTEKLILAERQGTTTILELQRGAKDCIVDVIVPIKAEANSAQEINNLSKKDITVSGAVNASGEENGMTIPTRQKASVTINGTLSDENRIKISCSDGK